MRRQIEEPFITRLLVADTSLAPVWLAARLVVGLAWLRAGWIKLVDPTGAWVGARAGAGVIQQLNLAAHAPSDSGVDVSPWYLALLERAVVPNAATVSRVLTVTELILGVAVTLGLLTGFGALAGTGLHASYLLRGDPLVLLLATFLVLGWRVAGLMGLDRWALPLLGVRGYPGSLVRARGQKPGLLDGPLPR